MNSFLNHPNEKVSPRQCFPFDNEREMFKSTFQIEVQKIKNVSNEWHRSPTFRETNCSLFFILLQFEWKCKNIIVVIKALAEIKLAIVKNAFRLMEK